MFTHKDMKDLFEHYEELPPEVLKVVLKYGEKEDSTQTYQGLETFLSTLEPLGYTFEYGLDGVPHSLTKMA